MFLRRQTTLRRHNEILVWRVVFYDALEVVDLQYRSDEDISVVVLGDPTSQLFVHAVFQHWQVEGGARALDFCAVEPSLQRWTVTLPV